MSSFFAAARSVRWRRAGRGAVLGAAVVLLVPTGPLQARSSSDWDPSTLESKVSEFALANGLRFVVLERHDTPVFSFMTRVNAGSVDEQVGQTGLAHMFEHMAFKGTQEIGTKDYGKEKQVIETVDRLYLDLYAERAKGAAADTTRLNQLRRDIDAAEKTADSFIVTNEFGQIIDRVGGVGLNASTAMDATRYYYSLPSNQLELWAHLESERFLKPVFREYYKERNVVMEERNMRVDSQPLGQFIEEMLGVAFRAHPYKNTGIGHRSDLENLTLGQAKAFFETYYTPQNMVVVVVGDVYPDEVKRLAQKYFARLPRRADPPPVVTVEPPQKGQRRFVLQGDTQPIFGLGFHRPDESHPDDAAFQVLGSILGDGRTSRLYKRLVKQDKSALFAGAFNGFPGSEYPSLFMVFSIPNSGHTPEEMEKVTLEEIERLKKEPVSAEELARVKTQTRAGFIRALESNSGLAGQLAEFEAMRGDWRRLFDEVARIEAVTAEQVQAIAQKYLTVENSTAGSMVTDGGSQRSESTAPSGDGALSEARSR
jgi:predicted Zn-dependent peptidase